MILSEATQEQKDAIESYGKKICILACAGSGKTYTITRRIAKLIDEKNVNAEKIAAITFTVLAAENLKQVLSQIVKNKYDSSRITTATIHSFCFKLLNDYNKSELEAAQVITENQQFILLGKYWKDWNIESVKKDTNKSYLIEMIISTFNIIKMEGVKQTLLQNKYPELFNVFMYYNRFLRENNYYDYSDLLLIVKEKFVNDLSFQKYVNNSFEYLFVDEYQDVDPLQAEIIEHFNKNITTCVVGDDDQAIYQFRGTDVKNIINFSKTKDCNTYILSTNRRCPNNILQIADSTIIKVKSRLPKQMSPLYNNGLVEIVDFDNIENEIDYITKRIIELKTSDNIDRYGDVAILMRSVSSYGRDYIESLKKADIPYIAKGGRNLFDTDEIKKIVAILEWILIEEYFELSSYSFLIQYNINDLLIEIKNKYYSNKFNSLLEIVLDVIAAFELYGDNNQESVNYNVAQFTRIVNEYEEISDNRKLQFFCGYLSSYAQKSFDEAIEISKAKNCVNLLTVHQAKGLEFDYVFIPMLVESRFPSTADQKKWLIDDALFDSKRYKNNIDNERRLFYVACTRAKKGLYLLASRNVGLKREKRHSIFFNESRNVTLMEKNIVPDVEKKTIDESNFLITSYSSLEYYLTCPYRYKLIVVYGLASPRNPFFEFGKVIHGVLGYFNENLMNGKSMSVDEVMEYYNTLFDKYYQRPNIPNYVVAKQKIRGYNAIQAYYENKNMWYSQVATVEEDFEYIQNTFIVRGRFDLIVKNKDKFDIIDFKTGIQHEYLRTDFQMQLYCIAAKEQYSIPVNNAILYYVESGEEKSYKFNKEFIDEGKKNIGYVINGIQNEQFEPKPDKVCSRCEVSQFCKYKK